MVWISRVCFRKYGNFVDNLRLYVRGGSGGMGLPRMGGQGGKGGDVWVLAKKDLTLKRIKDRFPHKRFIAGVGYNSSIRALKGAKGEDVEVSAPVGICVTTDDGRILATKENAMQHIPLPQEHHPHSEIWWWQQHAFAAAGPGKLIRVEGKMDGAKYKDIREQNLFQYACDQAAGTCGQRELNHEGEKLLVAKGGLGGSLQSGFLPSKGQMRHIRLDLRLIADLGLVGFPNAGKSSLLTALSHATPQIASYPFTTLRPEIGKVMYEDHKQVSVADLPGLIEGAHMNRGMGHKFLKHVERTKQLMFVVDVCGFQLASNTPFRSTFEAVQLLTKELELYKEELLSKPAILVVNKMDLPEAEEKLRELETQLENQEELSHLLPEDMIPKTFLHFRHIVPVSALTGLGLPHLKAVIRQSIEEQEAIETERHRMEKLQELRREIPVISKPTWGQPFSERG